MKQLPKKLYIAWQGQKDDAFLMASADFEGHALTDETVVVGEYELVRKVKIINKSTIAPVKK